MNKDEIVEAVLCPEHEVSRWVPQTWEQWSVSEHADSWICSSVWTSWIRFHVSLIPLTTHLHQQTVASPLVSMSKTPTTSGSYITHSAPEQSVCHQSLCLFHVFQTQHVQFAGRLSLSWDNPDDITMTSSGVSLLQRHRAHWTTVYTEEGQTWRVNSLSCVYSVSPPVPVLLSACQVRSRPLQPPGPYFRSKCTSVSGERWMIFESCLNCAISHRYDVCHFQR